MPRTTFGDSYDLVAGAATMYSYAPRGTDPPDAAPRLSHWFYDMPPSLWAGGGILTTADDTARWLVALQEGRLLEQRAVQQMWTAERLNDVGRTLHDGGTIGNDALLAHGLSRQFGKAVVSACNRHQL